MRHLATTAAAAAFLALAACGSEPEEEAPQDAAPAEEVAADTVRLNAEGLAVGDEAFLFNAGRSEVESALTRLLGEPARSATNRQCDAGPVDFVDYEGGLTVHFADGALVGWNWHLPYEGDAPLNEDVTVAGDVRLGQSRAEVEQREGYERIEDSTLGEEFRFGEVGGFIEADEVATLFAGTQCFLRGEEAAA
ncbi:MAG: aspartate-semialdehyde dehydrogenase [Erythrobacter sp.]|uniref:hypothetical protein n=1 Tax=Erythrobacter sp. HL-111 TaxID=1798193 RepID=UPI0006D9BB59|nr:hypothetical protein [Erythrobacter sp. HL-111]KPP95068.1 MAG: hypothetical protein HLUCCO15_03200 [Erythrobacteraceae bacterium HL-111]SDS08784.1 hypothetical protein SAMN04515621_0932 [Erythrobacter sp. HL-111]